MNSLACDAKAPQARGGASQFLAGSFDIAGCRPLGTSSPQPSPPQVCGREGENAAAQKVGCARHAVSSDFEIARLIEVGNHAGFVSRVPSQPLLRQRA
jgi:hypothetical protein